MKNEGHIQVLCPHCGNVFKVRFLELEGRLKYSIYCNKCKRESTIEIKDI